MLLVVALLPGLNGCKDFLNVTPVTDLSGNNYWKSEQDVEQFTRGLYNQLRDKVAVGSYFMTVGDLRCSPWVQNRADRHYIGYLARNQIDLLLTSGNYDTYFHFREISKWQTFYKIIQGANIMISKIDDVPDEGFSPGERKKYKAEGIFIRNLCYFFMVRMYGDVPYYTEPYHTGPTERMPLVEVLKNCVKDLGSVAEDLPWTYKDPAKRAVRAMRGGALILLMHMNMWLAGFDESNNVAYWNATDSLGQHLIDDNNGAYALLPLNEYQKIFDGRSKEGLFEIPQNLNYGESFGYSTFSDLVLHYPHKNKAVTTSYMYPMRDFLDKMFPPSAPDLRKDYWFDPDEMYKTDGSFEYLKYVNVFAREGEDVNPDDNMMIFRLPDAYLLRAEALNDLGKDEEAREMLNVVRNRAAATPVNSQIEGQELGDMIYWERCRELLGEHMYYYTLVRTKKVVSPDYCAHPMPVSAFKEGAWTWPLDVSVLENNPKMKLNEYWVK